MNRLPALGLVALSPWIAGDTVSKGDRVVDRKLEEVIWGFDGAESLLDYLGEPVLVDFWGTQ